MSSPFIVPGAPAQLQAIIDAHRARFHGMTMTAGAPEGGDGQQGEQQQQNPPAPGPLGAPKPKAPEGEKQEEPAEWDGKVESLPKGAQELIANLRNENATSRVKAKTAADEANAKLLEGLKAMKEAGILPDSVKLDVDDPVKVAQDAANEQRVAAEQARAELVLSQAELIVWRASQELGVNAAALTDSRAFEVAVKGLDPTAADFTAKVKEAAQEAAKQNPNLKATQGGSGRGGSAFNGGSGEGQKGREYASMADAIAADYQ